MQSKTRVTAAIVLLSLLQGLSVAQTLDEAAPSTNEPAATLESVFEEFNDLEAPLTQQEERYANMISQGAAAADWMGALTPVAISPFFGITCLSGVAIFAEDYLPDDHFLRRASSPLRQPLVFGAFLTLTIITAIPKLSKVSKPFAQACDQLETYSALVVLLVIRVMGQQATGLEPGEDVAVVYQAGVFEFSLETLLLLASAANILIINAVKFFFEILIWITPVPFIDAMFEASSKAAVVALTAVVRLEPDRRHRLKSRPRICLLTHLRLGATTRSLLSIHVVPFFDSLVGYPTSTELGSAPGGLPGSGRWKYPQACSMPAVDDRRWMGTHHAAFPPRITKGITTSDRSHAAIRLAHGPYRICRWPHAKPGKARYGVDRASLPFADGPQRPKHPEVKRATC